MPDDVSGFVLVLLALGVLVIVLRAAEHAVRPRTDQFWIVCPRGRGAVQCTLVREPGTGLWADVARCSAFADPKDVTCPKTCMKLVNESLLGAREGSGIA